MSSIGHRTVTVVTIVTLVYAPFFKNHHWIWKNVGRHTQTTTVSCVPNKPCPKTRTIVKKVYKQPTRAELRKAQAEGLGAPKPPTPKSKSRLAPSASRRR